tara:strand:+ start:3284 stop:5281 length:1998 start_codon:yes stop_codon:yes gene_type:complete
MKKIGICIKEFDSIFTNGCAQQGYFVMKSLRKAGFKVTFVSIEEKLTYFEVINEPVVNICDVNILKEYSIIVFSSLIVDQYSLLNQMKLLGIKIANLMVGNYYIINCEEFVFDVHNNVIQDMNNEYVDEIWLMPMYKHVQEYIECITKKPVRISPYVWDNEIIKKYSEIKKITPEYSILKNTDPIDIVLMEPNLSIHKNALPILVMLNKYFLSYPDRLGKIHLFGKPKRNEHCLHCIRHLEIVQCNKIILYPRTLSLEIFHRLRESHIKYLIISNNIRNGLNFIHLECFTLGIPIIHNCKPYKNNGLFYEDSDFNTEYSKAIGYINGIWDGSLKNNSESTVGILLNYHSYNKDNVVGYSELIKKLDQIHKPNIYDLNNILSKENNSDTIEDGFSIIIPIDSNCNTNVLYKNLTKLDKSCKRKYTVRLFVKSFNLQENIIKSQFSNLDIVIENTNIDNIHLYAISKTKESKVCYIDQNTIVYLSIPDIENLLKTNNSIVGVHYKLEGNENIVQSNTDYISIIFKALGKPFKDNKLVNPHFFMYNNSIEFRRYIGNFLNDYQSIKGIISVKLEIPFLISMLLPNIIFIDSQHSLITNKVNDNSYYPYGYLISSKKIALFGHIDNNLNKNINLDQQVIANYDSLTSYTIKNNTFYNVIYNNTHYYLQS